MLLVHRVLFRTLVVFLQRVLIFISIERMLVTNIVLSHFILNFTRQGYAVCKIICHDQVFQTPRRNWACILWTKIHIKINFLVLCFNIITSSSTVLIVSKWKYWVGQQLVTDAMVLRMCRDPKLRARIGFGKTRARLDENALLLSLLSMRWQCVVTLRIKLIYTVMSWIILSQVT